GAGGNPLWVQDGRPGADTTYFRYYLAGDPNAQLVRAVDAPADASGIRAVDSLAYDALGNPSESREGQGSALPRITWWPNDAIGRQIRVASDINSGGSQQRRASTGYDVMGRVVHTKAYAVATVPAGEFLQTDRFYDEEGTLRRLERTVSPPATGTPVS